MEFLKAPNLIKPFALILAAAFFFLLGKHWSSSTAPQPIFFFSAANSSSSTTADVATAAYIALSPNADRAFDVTGLIRSSQPPAPPPPPFPPPPPVPPERYGVLDEHGAMMDDFIVGEVEGPDLVGDGRSVNVSETGEGSGATVGVGAKPKVGKFKICDGSMMDYVPVEGKGLDCLVPMPRDYRAPIPWPRSRDEIWLRNVPSVLSSDGKGQRRMKKDKDKLKFPDDGSLLFPAPAEYVKKILEMVPEIAFGTHTRVVLDINGGLASFGAFLFSRNVITLSIAPKNEKIPLALERGLPAMIASFAEHRLRYPSQAFDLVHCSRCQINWTSNDGLSLIEVDRMLRAGGYFVWAVENEDSQQESLKEMENLTLRICWEFVKKVGHAALWRKPLNNSCYVNRASGTQPPLCDTMVDPDRVWYFDMKPCVTQLPVNGYGRRISPWPERLHHPPERLKSIAMDAHIAQKEIFRAESNYWNDIVGSYVRAFHWDRLKLQNVMDMRAGFGGFAAALVGLKINCWVMNVVPTSEPNTLPVIYDRGLIGVVHDWCKPFDTYPRTYDLLHAAGFFSREQKRCSMTTILLEMDRILRPGGRAYIRDNRWIIDEIKEITDAMSWRCDLGETEEGPYASRMVLRCEKRFLRP